MTDVSQMPQFETGNPEIQQPEQQTLFELESLTVRVVNKLELLQEEAKKVSQMIKDGFVNDAVYRDHDEQVKVVQKVRQQTKAEIMKQPGVIELVQKLKDIRAEIKEKKLSSSDYALEYNRLSGVNQIEVEGQVYEIVKTAKLVKERKK